MCDARNSEHKKACHAQQKNNTEGYHIFTESERELVNHTITLPTFTRIEYSSGVVHTV